MCFSCIPPTSIIDKRGKAERVCRRQSETDLDLLPSAVASVRNAGDVSMVMAGFLLLTAWRTPPIVVVIMGAIAGLLLSIVTG
jgi:hypothetical protein